MTTTRDARAFRLTRSFDAPRELVFRVWTQPDHLAQWFGPKGFTMIATTMDFRPGGVFHYGMRSPDGHEMWGKWRFRTIEAPASFEFLQSFSDAQGGTARHPMAAGWPLEMLSTVQFDEADGRTTLTLTALPYESTEAEAEVFHGATGSMQGGWKGTLDALEAYLAQVRQ